MAEPKDGNLQLRLDIAVANAKAPRLTRGQNISAIVASTGGDPADPKARARTEESIKRNIQTDAQALGDKKLP